MGITFGEAMSQAIDGLRRAVDRKLHRPLTAEEISAIHRSGDFIGVQELTVALGKPELTTAQAEAAVKQLLFP